MSSSIWAYFVVMMGIVSLLTVNYVGNFANNNELDYYAVKEIQQSAMMDSIDLKAFREDGEFRINKETFVEQFTKRFSKAAGVNRKYKITFKKITEEPPMTSILVESTPNTTYASTQTIDDLIIKNDISGILMLDQPVINITRSSLLGPSVSIKTVYKPCPYVNGRMDTSVPAEATVYVKGIETDNLLASMISSVGIKTSSGTTPGPSPILNEGFEDTYRLRIRPGQNTTYIVTGTATDAANVKKTVTESVILNAGDTCIPVVERPSVSIDPPNSCTDGPAFVNVYASGSQLTDIYYKINNGTVIKVPETKETLITITPIGQNTLKVWATPAGAGVDDDGIYRHMSPEKTGTYNVLDNNGTLTTNAKVVDTATELEIDPGVWTRNNLRVELKPVFSRGEANQSNTNWNWWTDTMQVGSTSWDGLTLFSTNRGNKNKYLTEEGRRRFKVTVDVPASEVGLGCTNVRLTSAPSNDYLIDKTDPAKPTIEPMRSNDTNRAARIGSNSWYTDQIKFKINSTDAGISTNTNTTKQTGSGIITYERQVRYDTNPVKYGKYTEQPNGTYKWVQNESVKYQVENKKDPEYITNTWEDRGSTRIRIRAVDEAGNRSDWEYITFKIDSTNPSCSNLRYTAPGGYSSGEWTKNPVGVAASCSDSMSGCVYTTPTWSYSRNQNKTRNFYVSDNAGNDDFCGSRDIKIDKVAPSISCSCSRGGACNPLGETAQLRYGWSVTDGGSKLVKVQVACAETTGDANASWSNSWSNPDSPSASKSGSDTIGVGPSANNTVRVQAEDKAGNLIWDTCSCPSWTKVEEDDTTIPITPARCWWN